MLFTVPSYSITKTRVMHRYEREFSRAEEVPVWKIDFQAGRDRESIRVYFVMHGESES